MESFSLAGRRALVTGAGRGLGRAVSEALVSAGADVTLCARTESEIAEAAAEIRSFGRAATHLVADVTDVGDFAGRIAELPSFDILVNNAGTNRPKRLADVSEDDYDAIMDLHVRAAIFATKAVTNRLLAEGRTGCVINMSSQMGHVGSSERTIYCASKWALEGFTKALAVELGSKGIRVNSVCPMFVETPMTAPFLAKPDARESILSKIKLGRLAAPSDIVGAVVYLASSAAAMVTGSSIMVDGGWTAE